MRIGLVTGEYPPSPGGVADYTAHLAARLRVLGVHAAVLTSAQTRTARSNNSTPADPADRIIGRWNFGSWRPVARWIRTNQLAVVHIQYQTAAYGMHPAINLLPLALKKLAPGIKVVTTFHDLRAPYLFPKAGPLRRLANETMARFSDALVFTDPADFRSMGGLASGKSHWVPIGSNILPSPEPASLRAAARSRMGIGRDASVVLYFGFFDPSKGLEVLLDAFSRIQSRGERAYLLLAGGAHGHAVAENVAYAARIERRLQKDSGLHRVRRLPYLPPQELSAHFYAADVAALPFQDGASLGRGTLVAALAHGVPVVSTRPQPTTGRPGGGGESLFFDDEPEEAFRLRHEENAYLVEPGNPEALADGIMEVAHDSALAATLAQGGQLLASKLSWERIAAAHLRLYTSFL